ncbi:MAG: transaldolase [Litorivicinus sp.]
MTTKLDALRQMTTVVADTGDLEAIKQWKPEDATTNPSLILKAAETPEGLERAKEAVATTSSIEAAGDHLAVSIGAAIQSLVPGYVSTEVDARLSFDTQATIAKAHQLVELYQQAGADTDRLLIKIASTWEGIQAAAVLEKEGIKCNLTLLFGFEQAQACADAGAFLISPFVGRILDWHKANQPDQDFSGANDPGVQSVQRIWQHYKRSGYNTVVMGASFRNTSEIEHLAGCDRLTIGPALLEQLANETGDLARQLDPTQITSTAADPALTQSQFRWQHNQDAMAVEKLSQGIRAFAADQVKLEDLLTSLR